MKQKIQKLKKRIVLAYLSDGNELSHEELEKEISVIENEINILDVQNFEDNDDYKDINSDINDLKKAVRKVKIKRFIYDEEIEMDLMLPDRHEPDFDEDSMSWDSVFGGD